MKAKIVLETQNTSKEMFFLLKDVTKIYITPLFTVVLNIVNVGVDVILNIVQMSFSEAGERMVVNPKGLKPKNFFIWRSGVSLEKNGTMIRVDAG